MKLLEKLTPSEQILAQIIGYKPFDHGEITQYIPMTKEEIEKNSLVLEKVARKIYLKYTGREIPKDMKFGFIRRTARDIKSTGICICKKEENIITPLEIKIEEELFFHPKEMIAVLKHELAHLYQIEETGKTRHSKNFKKLIHEVFKLSFRYIEENPKSLEKRLIYSNNLKILRRIRINNFRP